MTVFTSLDLASAASPSHRVPIQQIIEKFDGTPLEGVVLGTIQTAGSAARPIAIAVADNTMLIGQQLPFGINGFSRVERPTTLEMMRFDDSRTAVLITIGEATVPLELDDDDAAWLHTTLSGEDGSAALKAAVIVSRQEHQAAEQAQFRSEVSSTRWKIFGVMVAALAALFIIGSMMGR